MPFIEITLWEGRTREQKAEVARRITEVMVESAGRRRRGGRHQLERHADRVHDAQHGRHDRSVGGAGPAADRGLLELAYADGVLTAEAAAWPFRPRRRPSAPTDYFSAVRATNRAGAALRGAGACGGAASSRP
jgi:hypothetical protein